MSEKSPRSVFLDQLRATEAFLKKSSFLDDWYVLEGASNWAGIEGDAEQWRSVAAAMRSGEAVHHKRLACRPVGDNAWELWSPRNAVSDRDTVRVEGDSWPGHIESVLATYAVSIRAHEPQEWPTTTAGTPRGAGDHPTITAGTPRGDTSYSEPDAPQPRYTPGPVPLDDMFTVQKNPAPPSGVQIAAPKPKHDPREWSAIPENPPSVDHPDAPIDDATVESIASVSKKLAERVTQMQKAFVAVASGQNEHLDMVATVFAVRRAADDWIDEMRAVVFDAFGDDADRIWCALLERNRGDDT